MEEQHEIHFVQRTGMLTTLCIIAILLGVLGFLTALWTGGAQIFRERIQKNQLKQLDNQPHMPLEFREAQKNMFLKINQVTKKWNIYILGSSVVKIGLCGLLFLGGVMAFLMKKGGRTLLITAFIAGLLFEGLSIIPNFLMQKEIMDVTSGFMGDIMKNGPVGNPPEAEAIGKLVMKAGIVIGMLITFGWIAMKAFFYGYGMYYLKKREVVQLYENTARKDDFGDRFA